MSRYVTVPSQYVIYELPDEAFEILPNGMKAVPAQIVLEVMVFNGQAKRVGTVGMPMIDITDEDESLEDGEEDPPEGAGPWVSDG